jgi:uncharacterized protein
MDLTLAGALLAGGATSLHCVGMCGPLACGLGTFAKNDTERLTAASAYHAGRLFSYSLIGAICGGLGKEPLHWFFDSPAVILPWAMVIALLLIATGLEKKIPRPAFLQRFALRMRLRARNLPLAASGVLSGLLTPLLPCGPLYAMFIALLAAGGAVRGAELALAFGLGTIPMLWLAQRGIQSLGARRSPGLLKGIQRGMALLAALVLAWRLHGTLPLPGGEPVAKEELPSCCHPARTAP